MELHNIKLGNLIIKNNLFLAPLAGYTDCVFRDICYDFGAGLAFTEMVSAKGLKYDSEKTKELLLLDNNPIHAVQIFGNEPETMRFACENEVLNDYQIVDINMGCPVPKVYKNGEGSALLGDIHLAEKIIKECKKSGKIITVKFRIGLDDNKYITQDFAKMCEDAGADLITIHGRTRKAIYNGEVHFDEIAKAKQVVSIPVIANGGVFDKEDANLLLNNTGADGIMIARGALFNPHLFSQIVFNKDKKEWDRKNTIFSQISQMEKYFDSHYVLVQMRKMAVFYLKGERNMNKYKDRIFRSVSIDELKMILMELFENLS